MFTSPSVCVSPPLLSSPLLRTLVIGLAAQASPGWSYLEIFNLIIFAKPFSQIRPIHSFQMDLSLGEGHNSNHDTRLSAKWTFSFVEHLRQLSNPIYHPLSPSQKQISFIWKFPPGSEFHLWFLLLVFGSPCFCILPKTEISPLPYPFIWSPPLGGQPGFHWFLNLAWSSTVVGIC